MKHDQDSGGVARAVTPAQGLILASSSQGAAAATPAARGLFGPPAAGVAGVTTMICGGGSVARGSHTGASGRPAASPAEPAGRSRVLYFARSRP